MNYKLLFSIALTFTFSLQINAQKYFSKTADISFSSKTPLEDIEAESHTASTVFDLESGKIRWAVLIKSFEFEKALMQEHFNENYMESNKFPKADFSGILKNSSSLDFSKDGKQTVEVVGELTIHGVTQPIETEATFSVAEGVIKGSSELKILVADYGIEIPSVVKDNIAKEITIQIQTQYEVLK